MAELTYSKQAIRRAIGRATRQEFFLRYGDTGVIIASSDNTTSLVNFADAPAITQDTDFWQGQWLYDEALAEERLIINSSSGGGIDVEIPFGAAASSGDSFEIWGLWPPSIIHDAMNRSIRHAWDFFPNVVLSESLVLVEDSLIYSLANTDVNLNVDTSSDLLPIIGEVLNVWLEISRNIIDGQVTSTSAVASVLTFNDTETSFDTDLGIDSDWLISIYTGPCRGQLRQLNSVDTDGVITVDTGWDSDATGLDVPTTDSKYKAWDPSSQSEWDDWYKLTALRFDQPTDPDFMYLHNFYPTALGMRFRIQYIAQSSDLDTDADVTTVPLEFVLYKSMSLLYAEMVPDNRHDRASMAGLAEYYGQLAEKFANDEARPLPPRTIWRETDAGGYSGGVNRLNPLDWEGR